MFKQPYYMSPEQIANCFTVAKEFFPLISDNTRIIIMSPPLRPVEQALLTKINENVSSFQHIKTESLDVIWHGGFGFAYEPSLDILFIRPAVESSD